MMRLTNRTIAIALILCLSTAVLAQRKPTSIDKRVETLLRKMTIEEKAGQLTQYAGDNQATGPLQFKGDHEKLISEGKIGSMLSVVGAGYTRQYQEAAMRSRLKIPLLFGLDVIHGFKTTFPIPLAEAASWDLDAMEMSARIAATEASAGGIHWTFAPMVDIARDPRWGRVMEGAGEDTYLGSKIAFARVRGFQGKGIGQLDSVMACAKHFAAYGAAVGGRDYNSVDMSERQLLEVYLPPFKAANDAGVATYMNSFNDINGVPATASSFLQREVLKKRWRFEGFVVSDWGSIGEMVNHGYARDNKDAAEKAILAGNDMDMESSAYKEHLPELVRSGKVPIAVVNEAVRRVLRKKFELGLFEDPFRYSDAKREETVTNNPEHRRFAREIARKSIVLLTNKNSTLPLKNDVRKVALIGPMIDVKRDNHGFWSVHLPTVDYDKFVVSQQDGFVNRIGTDRIVYAKGCDAECASEDGFEEAVEAAKQADVAVVSIGERWNQSGEAKSRSDITIPGKQEELVRKIKATGKPVVVLINAGRPLVFDWIADNADAVVYTWWLGTEAGNAIADVLFGDYNPSGKLPMTFPRTVGQVPIYYNHFNTGRPARTENAHNYVSAYIDLLNSPKFAFGHGLSYTSFEYADLTLSSKEMGVDGKITVTFNLRNTGSRAGEEVAQLYLHDKVASLVRPIKELKDFQKIALAPGESKKITFVIDKEKLSFYNSKLAWAAEPGEFELMIGSSSADIRLKEAFNLK
ncbi:MAG: beta-glucosidase BglX [Pyrinomonadaceae bacterium]